MSKTRLRRMATASDYVPWEQHPGMFRLPWYDGLCPGNPTRYPETGAAEFNAWQCYALEAGDQTQATWPERLAVTVCWCLTHAEEPVAQEFAGLILRARRDPQHDAIPLALDLEQYPEPLRRMRRELGFSNPYLSTIPARDVLALQAMIVGARHDGI